MDMYSVVIRGSRRALRDRRGMPADGLELVQAYLALGYKPEDIAVEPTVEAKAAA